VHVNQSIKLCASIFKWHFCDCQHTIGYLSNQIQTDHSKHTVFQHINQSIWLVLVFFN